MEFSLFLIANILLLGSIAAQDDALVGFNAEEKDALYALKAVFDDPFLNKNWSGTHCFNNQPPLWYGLQCVNGQVTAISLDSLGLVANMNVNALNRFSELSELSLRNNSLSGNVFNFSSNPNLKTIDLSFNMFDGPIPLSLVGLNSLQSLQLQNNKLTGTIPALNQSSLRVFNVSNNNLNGSITRTHALQSFGSGSYSGNPGLCGPPSDVACNAINKGLNDTAGPDKATDDNSSTKSHVTMFLILTVVVFFVANLLLLLLYIKKHLQLKKIMKQISTDETNEKEKEKMTEITVENREPADEGGKLIFMEEEENFQLGDLLKASAEGLGKGIFGNSYKAMLEGKSPVVVKRLRDLKPLSASEFMKQVQVIAKQRHPNLLPLLAYFYTKDEKLLLYKYAEKGNLFDRLYGGRGVDRVPFRWSSRLSVAQGVARALEYLHLNTKPHSIIPHGNLKSSNVLLDDNNEVLVSDYGFASLVALPIAAQRMVSYKSPEYQQMKKVSRKSDVWSFGCLLIELLTGKISSHSAPEGSHGVDLCAWVNRAVREEWTAEIFDPEIATQRSAIPGMLSLLQIAIRCSNASPERRPEMTEIVKEVESIKQIENGEEYSSSFDQSLTDDSMSTNASGIPADER